VSTPTSTETELADLKARVARLESDLFVERARRIPKFQVNVELRDGPLIGALVVAAIWVLAALVVWCVYGFSPGALRTLIVAAFFAAFFAWAAWKDVEVHR